MIVIGGEKLINEKEASTRFGLSMRWFQHNRYGKNKIPYQKLNNHVYYKPAEVENWFVNNVIRIDE